MPYPGVSGAFRRASLSRPVKAARSAPASIPSVSLHATLGRPAPAAVVALKDLDLAKSRLAVAAPLRRRFALAMALDTIAALAGVCARVVVVSDEPGLAGRFDRVGLAVIALPDPRGDDLDAAFAAGAEWLARAGQPRCLCAVADLPALRAEDVADLWAGPDGYVADSAAAGTTIVLGPTSQLRTRFGPSSAAVHAALGLAGLEAPDRARCDVDTIADLRAAAALGLGARTSRLVWESKPATCAALTVGQPAASGWNCVDAGGVPRLLRRPVLDPEVTSLRPGQRLMAAIAGDGSVSDAWLGS